MKHCIPCVMFLAAMAGLGSLSADDAAPEAGSESAAAQTLISATIQQTVMGNAKDPWQTYAFESDSVLKWSNPAVGRVYGNTYLWTDAGRPMVIASLYRWCSPYDSFTLECSSLTTASAAATCNGRDVWRTTLPGIEWSDAGVAGAPAASRPQRLLQMKRLAERFRVVLDDTRNGSVEAVDLRMLSRQLYRNPEQAAVDGAVFAFVAATDPECLLVIESKESHWRYALARMNSGRMAVSLDGIQVHVFPEVPPTPEGLHNPAATYCAVELTHLIRP